MTAQSMTAVKITHTQLTHEALHGLIEEFVTRDGTDYGEVEISLETKIAQILAQLESGTAVIVFDQKSQTPTILSNANPVLKKIDE